MVFLSLEILRMPQIRGGGALSGEIKPACALRLADTAITRDRSSEMLTFNNIANARKRISAIKNQRYPADWVFRFERETKF